MTQAPAPVPVLLLPPSPPGEVVAADGVPQHTKRRSAVEASDNESFSGRKGHAAAHGASME